MQQIQPSSPLSPSSPLKPIRSLSQMKGSCQKVMKICLPYGKFSHALIGQKTNIPHKLDLFFDGGAVGVNRQKIGNRKRRNLSNGLGDVMSNSLQRRAQTARQEIGRDRKNMGWGQDEFGIRYIHSSQQNYSCLKNTNKKQKHHQFLQVKTFSKYHFNNGNREQSLNLNIKQKQQKQMEQKQKVQGFEQRKGEGKSKKKVGERKSSKQWNYLTAFYKKIIEKQVQKHKQQNFCLKSETIKCHNQRMSNRKYQSDQKDNKVKMNLSFDKNASLESFSKDKIKIVKGRLCLTTGRMK